MSGAGARCSVAQAVIEVLPLKEGNKEGTVIEIRGYGTPVKRTGPLSFVKKNPDPQLNIHIAAAGRQITLEHLSALYEI